MADDDQALSRTLSWILKENGYDVLTVPGGEHLFEHLTAEPFDLLLLDIMMPKVDGLQLLQRVKADPRFKDLPVLMISSMPPGGGHRPLARPRRRGLHPQAVPGAGAAGPGQGASAGRAGS